MVKIWKAVVGLKKIKIHGVSLPYVTSAMDAAKRMVAKVPG